MDKVDDICLTQLVWISEVFRQTQSQKACTKTNKKTTVKQTKTNHGMMPYEEVLLWPNRWLK